jgi:hypothetical protein
MFAGGGQSMTEAEWLACENPYEMLRFLRDKASDRKLRLFACACARRIWHLLADDRSGKAVTFAEQYADAPGDYDLFQLEWAENQAAWASTEAHSAKRAAEDPESAESSEDDPLTSSYYHAAVTAEATVFDDPALGAGCAAENAQQAVLFADDDPGSSFQPARAAECAAQVASLHDLFGNPFHPTALGLAWRTAALASLAQAVYDHRLMPRGHLDPARLAVLADALEEAGCSEQTILDHLRSPGPHTRGCRPVDLFLAKE